MGELERLRAQIAAEALRAAADAVAGELGNGVSGHTSTYSVRRWLHERADALGSTEDSRATESWHRY